MMLLLAGGVIGFGFYFFSKTGEITVESLEVGFLAQRSDLAVLLKQLGSIPDLDLSGLTEYEKKEDWTGALSVLADAADKNKQYMELAARIIVKTGDLNKEAEKIESIVLRPQAIDAILDLQNGNSLMRDYLTMRAGIFQRLNKYYSDKALKGGAVPPDFSEDVLKLDDLIAQAQTAYNSFNQKIDLFDKAAGLQ